MRKYLIVLLLLAGRIVQGQQIEVFAGMNRNKFYDFNREFAGHDEKTYFPGYTNSVGIAVDSVMMGDVRLRFSLQYDPYKGTMNFLSSGAGGFDNVHITTYNQSLGLGVYPLNYSIQGWQFNFGVVASALLSEKYSGTRDWASRIDSTAGNEVFTTTKRLCAPLDFGIQYRIAKTFKFSNSFSIVPQFVVYQGIAKQYEFSQHHVMSKRKYLFIGLNYYF